MRYEPDKQVQTQWLMDPNNRLEQVDGVIHFYLDKPLIESLDRARLLDHLAVQLFVEGDVQGYRAAVVRRAIKELQTTGWLDGNASPYIT